MTPEEKAKQLIEKFLNDSNGTEKKIKFTYIGETPAHGKIYEKGDCQVVIYGNGFVRYFPNWTDWQKGEEFCYQRNSNGMVHEKTTKL